MQSWMIDLDDLQLTTTEEPDGSLTIGWNEHHPLAVEVLNHWDRQDWIDVLRSEAGRVIRLYDDEPTDLW